jgi:hypothetical protein
LFVVVDVDTRVCRRAIQLSGRCATTSATDAALRRRTRVAAGSAIASVGRERDALADAFTVGLSGGTDTRTGAANPPAAARGVARATMVRIGQQVRTRFGAIAVGEACRRTATSASRAVLSGLASVSTGATVATVRRQRNAREGFGTVRIARDATSAFAGETELTSLTRCVAGAAMGFVRREIDATIVTD